MWDLWWAKWRWGKFSPSTLVSSANFHSTNFSKITITYNPGAGTILFIHRTSFNMSSRPEQSFILSEFI
jgi:hypothetical protein